MIGTQIGTETDVPRGSSVYAFGRLIGRRQSFYNNISSRAFGEMLKLIAGTSTDTLTRTNVNLRLLNGPGGSPVGPEWIFGAEAAPEQFRSQRAAPSYAMAWRFQDNSAFSYRVAHAELWVGDGTGGGTNLMATGYKFADVSVTGNFTKAENRPLGLDYVLEFYSTELAYQQVAMEALLKLVAGQSNAALNDESLFMHPLTAPTQEVPGVDLAPTAAPVPDLSKNQLERTWDAPAGTLTGRWNEVAVKLRGDDGIKRDFWRGGCKPDGSSCGDKGAEEAIRWRWALTLREGQTQCPSITSFTANSNVISRGDTVTLTANVENADTLTIDQGVGVLSGRSVTIRPNRTGTLTYTLTAEKANCPTARATLQVEVIGAPDITSFKATPNPVAAGTPTTVSYTVQGASTVEFDQGVGVVSGVGGTFQFTPTHDTVLTLTATNDVAVAVRRLVIQVISGPEDLITSFGAAGCSPSELDNHKPLAQGTPTDTGNPAYSIRPGGCVSIHWITSPTAGSVSIHPTPSGQPGSGLAPTGVFRAYPTQRTTYVITVTTPSAEAKRYLTVDVESVPTVDIFVTPSSGTIGEPKAWLQWSASNADIVNIRSNDPNAFGVGEQNNLNAPHSGGQHVDPDVPGTYTYEIEAYKSSAPTQKAVDSATYRQSDREDGVVYLLSQFKGKDIKTKRTITEVDGTNMIEILVAIRGHPSDVGDIDVVTMTPRFFDDGNVYPDAGSVQPSVAINLTPLVEGIYYTGSTRVDHTAGVDRAVYSFSIAHPSNLTNKDDGGDLTINYGSLFPAADIDCSRISVPSRADATDKNSVIVRIEDGVFNAGVGRGWIARSDEPNGTLHEFFNIADGTDQAAVVRLEDLNDAEVRVWVQGSSSGLDSTLVPNGFSASPACEFIVGSGTVINEFFANGEKEVTVAPNAKVRLNWDVSGADSVKITQQGAGAAQTVVSGQRLIGSREVTNTSAETITYRCLPVVGTQDKILDNNTAVVNYVPTPVPQLTTFQARVNTGTPLASPWHSDEIDISDNTTELAFQWSGSNLTRVDISSRPDFFESHSTTTQTTHTPGRARVYVATPYNGLLAGTPKTIRVTVGGVVSAKILEFIAKPSQVPPGGGTAVELKWRAKGAKFRLFNVTSGEVEIGQPGDHSAIDSRFVRPTEDSEYRLVATGAGDTDQKNVYVNVVNTPRVTFYADVYDTNGSTEVTFSWVVTSHDGGGPITALNFSIDDEAPTEIQIEGTPTRIVGDTPHTPTETTRYTLTATNSDGSTSAEVTVNVGGPPGGGIDPPDDRI